MKNLMKNLLLITFTMAYLNMSARVTISDNTKEIVIDRLNSFKVTESIKELSDQAVITIAKNYKELKGSPILNHIKAGMAVKIESGYNGNLATEFTGFVKPGIPSEFPLVIECDELFPLRQGNIVKSFKAVTLKELLHLTAPAYKIECPDTQLGKFTLNNVSPYQVLNELKKRYGFYSRINDNILSVGWAFDFRPGFTNNHEFIIGENVKDTSNLKFQTDIDYNVRVESTIIVNGKKKILTTGSKDKDAKVEKRNFGIMPESEAKKAGEAIYKNALYNGFSGSFVSYGIPRTHAGDTATLINTEQPERNGTYMIEKMELEYAESHINRINHLSYKNG